VFMSPLPFADGRPINLLVTLNVGLTGKTQNDIAEPQRRFSRDDLAIPGDHGTPTAI